MSFMIYGAYGFTGRLIAEEAKSRGLEPVLSGRYPPDLVDVAYELDLPWKVASFRKPDDLYAALDEVDAVLNCAGPFANTAEPMLEACLKTGTHYLDITGELKVLEYLQSQQEAALEKDIAIMPAVGFDVVATDCLAKRVADRVPHAEMLEIAFFGVGRVSRGTAKSAIEQAGNGGFVRHRGEMKSVPPAWRKRKVDFGHGPTEVVSIPWSDLITAYHSTGIPNIVTYARLPNEAQTALKASRYFQWLLEQKLVQRGLKKLVERQPEGPSEEERETGTSFVWVQAATSSGEGAQGRLSGPEPYTFTARSAVLAADRVARGEVSAGFQTPSTAFGIDFVEQVEGVSVEDLH